MKRVEMRIVGLNPDCIFVQRKTGKGDNPWEQKTMSFTGFFQMMQKEFPDYYLLCNPYDSEYEKANFFYNLGEDSTETYVFV